MKTLEVLLTQAPMSEPSAMHSDARFVDAEMLLEMTLSASPVSSGLACNDNNTPMTVAAGRRRIR
uniref:Uncharacterized protein n=1 Tax=Oryza glumipatula TaxID=40148 RepID=A0A0E0AUW1_9ORYZ